jgi:DNA-binding protein Fis
MAQEIKKITRFYNNENNGDEIFFDAYELILSKLEEELLVKDT